VKRILGVLVGLVCATAMVTPAVGASLNPAINDPGYAWALGPVRDLVAHHGWPAGDTTNLGRITTRRELARGLVAIMSARGMSAPAGLARPSDIAPGDPDLAAISWVSGTRVLGAPGVAFGPETQVSARTAELSVVRILGLGTELAALSGLHTQNGTRVSVPSGFGQEVLAAELGLGHEYPVKYEYLATSPGAPMPVAELAGMIESAISVPSWKLAASSQFSSIVLANMSASQRTVIQAAILEVGMPYVWGGTSPGVQNLWGAPTAGGFDCSGLVWWAYKLSGGSAALGLGNDLRGRTADQMAWENPSERIPVANLRPGDLVFFGDKGPKSPRGAISHTAISLGNGWIVQSTGSRAGVSVTHLGGYWDSGVAWGRRPAAMGQVSVVVAHHPTTTPPAQMTHARWVALKHFIHTHYSSALWGRVWAKFTSHPAKAYALLKAHRLV
jgi:cell wall-associated NlpC family hydrolase